MSFLLLPVIETYITHYGMGILLLLGNIGNIFAIFIFHQHRRNACSVYLSSAGLINIIYLTFNVPIYISTSPYDDPTIHSLIFCKLRFYLSHVFGQMARYFIVLACFDRYIKTNISFCSRNLTRPIVAKHFVLFVTIFWCIIGSHQLIFTTIHNQICAQFGIYYLINSIYLFISFSITPPVLMIVFGYLAYNQIKQSRARMRTTVTNQNRYIIRRRDRELLVMILTEVFIYVITTIPYIAISLESLLTIHMTKYKSIEYIQIEKFIQTLSIFFIYVNHAAPFYIYIFVSKGFRHDFKKLIRKCCHRTTTVNVIARVQNQVQTCF